MQDIREADWKRFRPVREAALQRFCQRVLSEAAQIAAGHGQDGASYHERYGKLYGLIKRRDKELARMFDGMSRSSAMLQLAMLCKEGLVTEEEFAIFSPELQERVQGILSFAMKQA